MNPAPSAPGLRPPFPQLIAGSIGIAQRTLEDAGEFLPYLALLDERGDIQIVHCDDARIELLSGPLIERLGQLAQSLTHRAHAVFYDALTGAPGQADAQDAIAIVLSDANGVQSALMPYADVGGDIRFSPLRLAAF